MDELCDVLSGWQEEYPLPRGWDSLTPEVLLAKKADILGGELPWKCAPSPRLCARLWLASSRSYSHARARSSGEAMPRVLQRHDASKRLERTVEELQWSYDELCDASTAYGCGSAAPQGRFHQGGDLSPPPRRVAGAFWMPPPRWTGPPRRRALSLCSA